MREITGIREMQRTVDVLRSESRIIGVVPTMGFLHDGHLSLIRLAKQRAGVVITTIFVNPAQFAAHEDFAAYPRDLGRDRRLAESAGTDILFVPSIEEMYPAPYRTFVEVEQLTAVLEGKARPTHFRGVATVVAKLFNITKPHIAIFGQKDAQQAIVVGQMAKDMNFDLELIVAPIVREADGLALSSRNVYLQPYERKESLILRQSLQRAVEMIAGGERRASAITDEMVRMIRTQPSANVDYVAVTNNLTLDQISVLESGKAVLISLAVRFGTTRLIDNMVIQVG